MDLTLLIVLISFVILVILGIFLYRSTKPLPQKVQKENEQNEAAPRRVPVNRNQRVRLRAQRAENVEEEPEVERETEVEIDEKMGAKKRAKLEAKAEKKARRETEERLRDEKKKREKLAEEEKQKLQEQEEAEEKKREEEEQKVREEKERKEHEEYLKMKAAFSVEEEGYEENDENQQTLQDFVNYIKENKVIVIEDLAAHFKLKTQAAIDRLNDLQKDHIISGVMDDRGKFIYISEEELKNVAKFIKQQGRISLTELAESSNRLINLNPSPVVGL